MKSSMKFRRGSEIMDKVDEVIFEFDPNMAMRLNATLKQLDHRTVILVVREDINVENLELVAAMVESNPHLDFKIRIGEPIGWHALPHKVGYFFHGKNIKYFSSIIARDFEQLADLIAFRGTDIYIGEGLGFDLRAVKMVVPEEIQIRVFPNIAQATTDIVPYKKFFIRPEDMELYEQYINVYEFWEHPDINSDILYNVYFTRKQWIGDLKDLIIDLGSSLNNSLLTKYWGERRANCEKVCFKGNPCQFCEQSLSLITILEINYKNKQKESKQYDFYKRSYNL